MLTRVPHSTEYPNKMEHHDFKKTATYPLVSLSHAVITNTYLSIGCLINCIEMVLEFFYIGLLAYNMIKYSICHKNY